MNHNYSYSFYKNIHISILNHLYISIYFKELEMLNIYEVVHLN